MKLKLISFLLIAWLFSHQANAQAVSLSAAYEQDIKIRKAGMLVLGSWAVGNILIGGIGRKQLSGESAYFHEMNLIWNVVNLGIAGAGYYFTTTGEIPTEMADQYASQVSFQKILLFNAGLDIAYMVGGLYLMEKAKDTRKLPERLRGYGKSIVLQGAFLFTFDLILYTVHQNKATPLTEVLSHLILSPQQIGFIYQF